MEEEGRPLRVIVSVNGQKFRVPCNRASGNTVGWLGDNVARRYERHNKLAQDTVKICELRGHDASVLDPTDSVVDACDEMEELVGVLEYLAVSHSSQRGSESVSQHQNSQSSREREQSPFRSDRADDVTPSKTELISGESLNQGHQLKAGSAKPQNISILDCEPLDSWAAEGWKVSSMEGHRDGVTCVEWTEDLVLSGGRYEQTLAQEHNAIKDAARMRSITTPL